MDPRQFLDLALILKNNHASPSSFRSTIGRAYYAAFNVGTKTLDEIGIRVGEGGAAHCTLRKCLASSKDDGLRDAERVLGQLHSRRLRADYRMGDSATETLSEAEIACLEARKVIEAFDDLLMNRLVKSATIDAMKNYARNILRLHVV
ncbi:hypothetical protein [Aquisphaera giovannonii]|uniref:hypothetical protein n=1 Tax=Aquisphaera giovannonii TaxID=406548 RepID=UPI0011DFD5A1|nr:hypothetical protein [Aquisphaera giovannonii]